MEVFKSPAENKNESPSVQPDWNAIVRNSFIFSQGLNAGLQTPITRWLAMGPLYDQYVSQNTRQSVKESIGKYTQAAMQCHHTATTAEGQPIVSLESEADKVLDNFQYELDQAFTFSDEERIRQREVALIKIAEGLVNRDKLYLIDREGRPIGEGSHRDKWSSFIIDFGIFHKGDGFYTWNGTHDVFKEFWEEALPIIRQRYPDELSDIGSKYIATHPNLTDQEKQLIKSL